MNDIKILIVDDETDINELLKDILEDEGYNIYTAENAEQANKIYSFNDINLVLLDIWLPDEDGISLLQRWQETNKLKSTVIMMSGHGTIETAVNATKLGAFDFIEKPISMAKLLIVVNNAVEKIKLEQKNSNLISQINKKVEVIGKSPLILDLKQTINKIALTSVSVLFTGEAGTGKNFYARYLHHISSRSSEPFIVANILNMSDDKQMQYFIGSGNKNGLIDIAENGALFIDEISNLSKPVQSLLAQILEQQEYNNLEKGGIVKTNVRFYFATRYNLEQLVSQENISKDLYQLIQITQIKIPSLNQYSDDIPELIDYFIDGFVSNEKLPYRHFSMRSLNFLRQYNWAGNILELKNFIQRVLVLDENEEVHLEEVSNLIQIKPNLETSNNIPIPLDLSIRDAREIFERIYLTKQLEYCKGNISELAKRVGLERTNLYRKLKNLKINYKK